MHKYKVFDVNWHPTVNEQFKDYKRNTPVNQRTFLDTMHFDVIGSNMVGLPNIGDYSHDGFYNLVRPFLDTGKNFYTVPFIGKNDSIDHQIFKGKYAVCLKVHPRFICQNFLDVDWNLVAGICSQYNLALGICTYFDEEKISAKSLQEICLIIDRIIQKKIKIILFHGFGNYFSYFYSIFGDNRNILFDTSFSLLRCTKEVFDNYCEALNSDRRNICFGSDFPDNNLDDHLNVVNSMCNRIHSYAATNFLSDNAIDFFERIKNGFQ